MSLQCPGCNNTNSADFEEHHGALSCTNCGAVVRESNIINDQLGFGESSSGAATVTGQFIGAGQAGVRSVGRFRVGGASESRETILYEARRSMNGFAGVLNIPEDVVDKAVRWYNLAVSFNFTKGRKASLVQASCLYLSCRQRPTPHMLIDFSDILRVNVFVLGSTYLRLIRILNQDTSACAVPSVDPAMYIQRFAKHLEFGAEQPKVAEDAIRIVQRMNRDWIVQGRRPSGICGAALILAARMNNFRRSVREVVYIVKVADDTVLKRLKEFKSTASGDLTVEQFKTVWLDPDAVPPCLKPKKKKRVRTVNDDGEVVMEEGGKGQDETEKGQTEGDEQADGAPDAADKVPEAASTTVETREAEAGENGEKPEAQQATDKDSKGTPSKKRPLPEETPEEAHVNAIAETAIEAEISAALNDTDAVSAADKLHAESQAYAEQLAAKLRTNAVSDDPSLSDMDDDWEVQGAMLNEDERALKEKIWVEFNKDWLKEQERKRLKKVMDEKEGRAKKRQSAKRKPRDSSAPDLASSPAESAVEFLKRRTFSKKINYKAMEDLFRDD